jgi:hypothetical protein
MNGRPILVSITLLGVASFGAPRDLQFLLQVADRCRFVIPV